MEFFHIGEGVFVMEALFPHKVSISNLGQVNSGSIKAQAILDDAVLYPNPYKVISQTGYTKHYYALFWCVISELIISFLCNDKLLSRHASPRGGGIFKKNVEKFGSLRKK